MEHFGTIGIVFCLLLLIGLGVVLIHEIRAIKKMETEREECFSMISRCSQLLGLLEDNTYMTDSDFKFLRSQIYRNHVRIHNMPRDAASSEKERQILAKGLHWTSVLQKCGNGKNNREIFVMLIVDVLFFYLELPKFMLKQKLQEHPFYDIPTIICDRSEISKRNRKFRHL